MNAHKLKSEAELWVKEGIIDSAQAARIVARYDTETPAYRKMSFWLQAVAAVLGCLALFLVISANWQHLSWFAQSIVVALPLIAGQAWALWQEKKKNALAAEIGWFLASLALGANIMLQAQIFHISAYYPNGMLFWVIGILPILWFRTSSVHFLLASLLFAVYLGLQRSHDQFSWISLLPLAALAWFGWFRQRAYTVLPLFFILYLFTYTILDHWQIAKRGIAFDLSLVALFVALLQQFVRLSDDWLRRSLNLFFICTAFFNLLLTFKFFARDNGAGRVTAVELLVLALSAVSLAFNRSVLRQKGITYLIAANILLTMGFVALQGAAPLVADKQYYTLRIGANAVYLGSMVFLLFHAFAQRAKLRFMAALGGILFWALVRYFDLFSDYLTTALIFALSAAALIVANKLWEKKYEN